MRGLSAHYRGCLGGSLSRDVWCNQILELLPRDSAWTSSEQPESLGARKTVLGYFVSRIISLVLVSTAMRLARTATGRLRRGAERGNEGGGLRVTVKVFPYSIVCVITRRARDAQTNR